MRGAVDQLDRCERECPGHEKCSKMAKRDRGIQVDIMPQPVIVEPELDSEEERRERKKKKKKDKKKKDKREEIENRKPFSPILDSRAELYRASKLRNRSPPPIHRIRYKEFEKLESLGYPVDPPSPEEEDEEGLIHEDDEILEREDRSRRRDRRHRTRDHEDRYDRKSADKYDDLNNYEPVGNMASSGPNMSMKPMDTTVPQPPMMNNMSNPMIGMFPPNPMQQGPGNPPGATSQPNMFMRPPFNNRFSNAGPGNMPPMGPPGSMGPSVTGGGMPGMRPPRLMGSLQNNFVPQGMSMNNPPPNFPNTNARPVEPLLKPIEVR